MLEQLKEELKTLAGLIDPEHVRKTEELQDKLFAFEPLERVPVAICGSRRENYTPFPHDEEFGDRDKMLLNQLVSAHQGALLKDDRVYVVRADYGVAMVPSLFGAEYHVDETSTWSMGVNDTGMIKKIVSGGVPDVTKGLTGLAMETQAYFTDCFKRYGLDKYVHVAQCDSQSPIDVACMVWGNDIWYAMVDEPGLVHGLLDLATETIIAFINAQKSIIDFKNHWYYHVGPGVRVVDDSSICLSPGMYNEFVRPYNERVIAAVNGNGHIHYCGHLLQHQHERLHTKGLVSVEIGGENTAESVPGFTLANIWQEAYEHSIVLAYLSDRLPEARPGLDRGLFYIPINLYDDNAGAIGFFNKVREFWS